MADLPQMGQSRRLAALRGGAEFYVGYLPVPPGLARFVFCIASGLLALLASFAVLLANAQHDPGDAVWDDATARSFHGVIAAQPYPHLRIPRDDPQKPVESLLLVEVGKFGGGQRAAPLAGQAARISGWILERDGRRMLELEPGVALQLADGLTAAQLAQLAAPVRRELGPVTLRGEIVDSKCYLGAMKPGAGKTHKECATLCIAGGIPPVFVTRDSTGQRQYFLLTDAAGQALAGRAMQDHVLPFVADAVEISGQLEACDDLLLLKIDPRHIRRL